MCQGIACSRYFVLQCCLFDVTVLHLTGMRSSTPKSRTAEPKLIASLQPHYRVSSRCVHLSCSATAHESQAIRMSATHVIVQGQGVTDERPFSLKIYLLIVFALSWPIQIAYIRWGTTPLTRYSLSSLAMVMVTVATYIAGRYVFRGSFANAGWHWGKPRHYVAVMGLVLLVQVVPILVEMRMGMRTHLSMSLMGLMPIFVLRFIATLIPAFGEEFGWRGYMLPHLARRYPIRKAVLIHSLIWWSWHIPILVGMGLHLKGIHGGVAVQVLVVLLVSLIPGMMHAVVFAYIWTATQSLAVVSAYHSAIDESRDTIEASIGFGPLADPWESGVYTLLGAGLLWKAAWNRKPALL